MADAVQPAYVRVFEYPNGYVGNLHQHRLAQLVCPIRGIADVVTPAGTLCVSPATAVTVPPWQPHRVAAHGNALLHALFVDPGVYPAVMVELSVVAVSPLLRELIREAGRHYIDFETGGLAARSLALAVDLVAEAPPAAGTVWLPQINHVRLRRALDSTPIADMTSAAVASRCAWSQRQFSRVFRAEAGMPFRDWRALLRVQRAMRLLAQGQPVTQVAAAVGMGSASNFISLFRRHTGVTPGAMNGIGPAAG